jgi:hypothetical protein
MRTLAEIEGFLESQTNGEFRVNSTREEKVVWVIVNSTRTRSLVFKMRSCGRKSWLNFLWAYGLEETVTLTKVQGS